MNWKKFFRQTRLTDKERLFFLAVMGLLLLGWVVKSYRRAHPPQKSVEAIAPVKK